MVCSLKTKPIVILGHLYLKEILRLFQFLIKCSVVITYKPASDYRCNAKEIQFYKTTLMMPAPW
jgi:hypothetical protein